MSNNSALWNKHTNLIPSVFQQLETAGACPAWGHKGTQGKCSFGIPQWPLHPCHIHVTRGDSGSRLMPSSRHGQGELPPSPVELLTLGCQALRQGTALPLLGSCVIPVTCHPVSRAGESSGQGWKQSSQTLFCITCSHTGSMGRRR